MNEEILKSSRISRVAEILQCTCEELSLSEVDFQRWKIVSRHSSLTERSKKHKRTRDPSLLGEDENAPA